MLHQNSITKGYAQTQLGQIHYLHTPASAGLPTLVLLHQTPSSGEMFRPLMQLLANDFYCIAPDFIGFGNSDPVPDQYGGTHSVALYANSVWLCLQQLQVQAPVLFGHHTGVAVAAQLEHEHPGFCHQLIFSGPTLLSDTQKQALPAAVVDASLDEQGDFMQRYWQKIRGKDSNVPLQLSLRECLLALRLGDSYKKAYQAVAKQDFAAQIAAIQCPTLVFAGERDVLHAMVAPTVALLPLGQAANIGDASTYVCETHSKQLAQLIRQFCNTANPAIQ
ncbi:alpha/beta hydrolase [Rheinheimera sp. 1928-s]|uniref:alpha/beta fold hydrolase n=1 Tax=Rheinheimera sp. 1928-s TaxID=3033803 RepID=UPI0026044454|nr:alpha/beta hydrolase [Rheinheimera sp. 1928-s]MDF3125330.1 alpha/beta hydrolase [Rheinheimera sp. 1928-s]